MNRNTAKALLRDAYAQVVDNMMFRVLMVLLMVCVLPTFMIGIREDAFVVLHFWRFPYEEIAAKFGGSEPISDHLRQQIVAGLQAGMVDLLAGKMGVLLSVAATAFFTPRMLERGAADTIFSKPVSRLALMLSRYVAGLIFVSILAVVLVGGMHIGLLVTSGYSDPGFLWSILTLIYVFAVMHAFSTTVGVFTRSSVAALLLTMIFFLLNSCVHGGWELKETATNGGSNVHVRVEGLQPEAPEKVTEEESRLVHWLIVTSDVLHYTLPKTGDAPRIAKRLRRGLEERHKELADPGRTDLVIDTAPAGFTREPRSSLVQEGALWICQQPAGAAEATVRLALRPLAEVEGRVAEARKFLSEREADPASTVVDDGRREVAGRRAEFVEWHETREAETRLRRRWYFQSGVEWLLILDYDAELEWASAPEREQALDTFLAGMHFPEIDDPFQNPHSYERKFGFDAEWKYNAWFSIGTTLAFLVLTLLVGWWKLSRIDF